MGSVNTYGMVYSQEGIWSSKIRKECVSRYRERGSRGASLVKARGSKLGAETQENLERGGVRGSAWQEGRLTSARDALRIIHDRKQGYHFDFFYKFQIQMISAKRIHFVLSQSIQEKYTVYEMHNFTPVTYYVSLIPARGLNTARRKEQHSICLHTRFMLFYECNRYLSEGSLTLY